MNTTKLQNADKQEFLLADGLKKSYGKRSVVKDVSICVNPGEIVGLLGPNGAGKTTCFYMIVGLIAADAGSILLNNEKITRQAIHQRAAKGLSYLPQEPSVFRKLTVEQNILAVLQLQKNMTKSARKEQLEMLLEELQITHIRKNLAGPLSGGERRRVEIARALATNPHFILLDEPFAGVDPIVVIEIQRIIGFLKKKNIGVLITDHNVRETLRICDKAYIINDGVVLASGTPDDIVTNPTVRKVYLGEHFQM